METDPASQADPPALYLSARSAERAFQVARLDFRMARPIAAALPQRADRAANVARVASQMIGIIAEPAVSRSVALAPNRGQHRSSRRHVMPRNPARA